jgi:hypothetical protein
MLVLAANVDLHVCTSVAGLVNSLLVGKKKLSIDDR